MDKVPLKKQDWEHIQEKKTAEIFQIITGQYYYSSRPFSQQDLQPDLILKWEVPAQKAIKRTLFHHVSAFVNLPAEELQQAYSMAEKKILSQMQKDNENTDMNEIRIRMQSSIDDEKVQPRNKQTSLLHQNGEAEKLQFYAIDQKSKTLDGFTLYFNTVMYTLQKHCGFRVRAFIVHKTVKQMAGWIGKLIDLFELTSIVKYFGLGTETKVRYIYLFLNLSQDNLMKIGNRYRIKKSIDTTNFDFSLNDPMAEDFRPLKLHSSFRKEKYFLEQLKKVSRYFDTFEDIQTNAQVMEEKEIPLIVEQMFKSYWEEAWLVLGYFKDMLNDEASNQQKVYIHDINRGKLNPGCQIMYARSQKRRDYYLILKQICEKYGFPYYQQTECYGEFILPSKTSKGGFFQKLELMLSYNPVYSSPFGDLSLFSSMQKTKICYLTLKSTFKISYLNQLGIDVFCLDNNFQKKGDGGEELPVKGGLDGSFVIDRWNIFALFSDIRLIRSYYGDAVAYEVMLKGQLIIYLFSISIPYIFLYVIENLYEQFSVQTSQIETALFAVSFGIFTLFIEQEQQRFKIQYEDNRQQRVFLKHFRGPYVRNPLTDEMNEFKEEQGILSIVKSFICILILSILIIIFAYIFYGCRKFHLQIFDALYAYKYNVFNLSAIISYSMYFFIGDVFKIKFYGFIVRLMILIKNPPDQLSESSLKSYFTFYYLLSLEFIPIIFFYIIEPLQNDQCFGNCFEQYFFYVTARFTFNFVFALIKLVTVVVYSYFKRQLYQRLENIVDKIKIGVEGQRPRQKQANNFQNKLKNLIMNSIKESEKDSYEEEIAKDILALFSYSFYCTAFALSGVVAFLYICTIYLTTRTSLLFENRRPINKSAPIVAFSKYCSTIYFCGLLANIWVNTFLLSFVENYYSFLYKWAPDPVTVETSFMVKILASAFFFLLYSLLGFVVRHIASSFSIQTLFKRQRNKYKSYLQNVKKPKSKQNKIQEVQPLKFMGRVTNPEKMPHEFFKFDNAKFLKFSPITQNVQKPGYPVKLQEDPTQGQKSSVRLMAD